MKNIPTALFFVPAICFFIVAAIKFFGSSPSDGAVWLCLGTTFLCLGVSKTNQVNKATDKDAAEQEKEIENE